ncbi:MAG: DUF3110 domain-containing protein [Pseudanabaena sp.]|jgi:hypothetical protein|nr:DUF3110 domain-containing protein [Pseudanabaena sp. M090S1SP2A07QC]MCA6506006.1 DUF3110 domain-containing protein [Pseudanabaena sp. M172S2SP2A07QC]MCA6519152.1 DUF3110 domain-containing protein [Pseudanabaena sp. M110S1SP2A07QC]MCA6522406.1 DUF3110 domain-containing protein [Pseudanabaena sp. M051S1SP2A07QC]MCA6525488.1 DUF3110 domain-containing protein [Pseudanabaena sp. M179S2SP2A07QC]MCA6529938.1 DUF3110 domain-containing protein [Pseudanabaena sp. M125S2SP2A07QC]MCA6532876.1 DUF3110 
MQVWVLLFNANTDNEGIYTLEIEGNNIIVAFEQEDDAIRYAGLLEAQDFLSPTVERIDKQDLEEFCEESGYDLNIVPTDALLVPPEKNVDKTDWSSDRDRNLPESDDDDEVEDPVIAMMRRRLENLL